MLGHVPLSLSLVGLMAGADSGDTNARRLIEHAASLGPRAIRLDGTLTGSRARDLDRSARRDLASLLRRIDVGFGGIDLWIPPEHFTDPVRSERALDAVRSAIDLCAEMATLDGRPAGRSLSVSLPTDAAAPATEILDAADRASVRVVDHGPDAESRATSGSPFAVGVDPAALLLRSVDPVSEVARLGQCVVAPRLSDTDGISRVTPGAGRLDLVSYAATLAMLPTSVDAVLDARGLRSPDEQVRETIDAWARHAPGAF